MGNHIANAIVERRKKQRKNTEWHAQYIFVKSIIDVVKKRVNFLGKGLFTTRTYVPSAIP